MSAKLKTIPLSQLHRSKTNVRKTGRLADIESLAASIETEGLLQNLVVRPNGSGNTYCVDAGGRRLAALKLLARRKKIARDYPVRCLVRTEEQWAAIAASLAENFARVSLHPADQFDAFAELNAGGLSVDEIAARYGVTPTFVLQRLKLAAVSPRLVAEYRKGSMTLEQLSAFTLTDDHGLQEQVWFDNPYTDLPVTFIRQNLMKVQIDGDDRRARFIGAKAYEAAGGIIIRDLFDEAGEGYFADSQLLERLVTEELTKAADSLRAEGWEWVEVHQEWDFSRLARHGRAQPTEQPLSKADEKRLSVLGTRYDELVAKIEAEGGSTKELDDIEAELECLEAKRQVWPHDVMARTGAVIGLDPNGRLKIVRGLTKPDAKRDLSHDGDPDGHTVSSRPARYNGYSASLVLELSVQRTAALQEVLASQPETAFIALLYTLVGQLLYPGRQTVCLGITATEVPLGQFSQSLDASPAAQAFKARRTAWSERLPEKDGLWEWLAALSPVERLDLMAVCIAMTVNALDGPKGQNVRQNDVAKLTLATGLDMTVWWKPTRENFLDRVTKQEILDAVSEGVSPQAANRIAGDKKDRMAAKAEKLLAETTWLPLPLKAPVPCPQEQSLSE